LQDSFLLKWWDKFDFSKIQSCLNIEFPFKSEVAPTAQAQVPVAQLQSLEPAIKLPKAPKSESPTSSTRKKPTNNDVKTFALAFAKQFYKASDEEEEDSTAESSVHLSQIDPYQDAQDPYNGYHF
jgi:hypothetical protein